MKLSRLGGGESRRRVSQKLAMRSACRLEADQLDKDLLILLAGRIIPMEHDPLRHCHYAVLCLVQGRQLRLESFIGERHGGSNQVELRSQLFIGAFNALNCTACKKWRQRSGRVQLELQRLRTAVNENYATKVGT